MVRLATTRRFRTSHFIAAALAASLGAISCGSTEDGVCSAKCDCEGCSDARFDDCMSGFDSMASRADRLGCSDLYDDYLSCLDDTGHCRAADFEADCSVEKHRLEGCIGDVEFGGGGSHPCVTNADCTSGGAPICNAGACVECTVDSQCDPGKVCRTFKCE